MDTTDKDRSFGAILRRDAKLADLYKKGLELRKLDEKLKGRLDPGLERYFELANINNDVAVLLAHSPAWAARLRYSIPAILGACRELGLNSVKTVRIKVRKTVE